MLLNLSNDVNKCTECSFIGKKFFSTLERNSWEKINNNYAMQSGQLHTDSQ